MVVPRRPRQAARKTDPYEEYAISRRYPEGIATWEVSMSRQGYSVIRRFPDDFYGGSDATLKLARAYRDELLKLLPPTTNRDNASRLRSNNRSGVAGVYLNRAPMAWEASCRVNGRNRQRRFSIDKYGARQAKAMAVAQREAWIAEMDVAFMTQDPIATKAARLRFPERLGDNDPGLLDKTTLKARIKALDARFDALRPFLVYLSVSVRRRDGNWILTLKVSDDGPPPRLSLRKQVSARSRQSIAKGLLMHRDTAAAFIAGLHGQGARRKFLADHGSAFEAGVFNIRKGLRLEMLFGQNKRGTA